MLVWWKHFRLISHKWKESDFLYIVWRVFQGWSQTCFPKKKNSGSDKQGFFFPDLSHFADPSQEEKRTFPAQMNNTACYRPDFTSLSLPRGCRPAVATYCVFVWVSGSLALSCVPSCPAWNAATARGWLTHGPLSCSQLCCRMSAGSLLESVQSSGSSCHTLTEKGLFPLTIREL